MLLLVFIILGFGTGLLVKGKLSGLVKLRGLWLPIVAVSASAILGYTPHIPTIPKALIISLSYICNFYFFILNRYYIIAAILSGFGTLSNFIVIALNSFRMPISEYALIYYPDMTAEAVLKSHADYFVAVDGDAKLLILGDVICVPIPYLGGFISVGDVFLSVGIFVLIVSAMTEAKKKKDYVFY